MPQPGKYRIIAQATDRAGLSQAQVSEIAVHYDASPPDSAITAPANGQFVTSLSSISGTASDNFGVERVEVSIERPGGQFWEGTTWISSLVKNRASLSAGNWSYLGPGGLVSQGTYTVRAYATENEMMSVMKAVFGEYRDLAVF